MVYKILSQLKQYFTGNSQMPKLCTKSYYTTPVSPMWMTHDYDNYAMEGYGNNPIVYACIRSIVQGVLRVPLTRGQGLLYSLLQSDYHHFIQSALTYLHIHGNVYIQIMSDASNNFTKFYVLRPDRVTINADDRGWLESYTYRSGGSVSHYHPSRIVHLKFFSPLSDYYGQSPLKAVARAIDIHNASTQYQKSLLDNSARPSGCLVYNGVAGDSNHLTEDQFNRLKEELEEHYTGSAHAGRPMLLEGGLEWKPMSYSPSDMQLGDVRHAMAREISLALGVPPLMLGIPGDSTYSNYQEALRAFTRSTILPTLDMLLCGLNQHFETYFGDLTGDKVSYDANTLPAFLPEQESLWARVSVADFLTAHEKRAILGVG